MTTPSRRPPRLPSDHEIAQAREASRQLARLLPTDDETVNAQALRLVTDDNHHEMIAIPPSALRLLVDMLTQLGQGRAVTVLPQNAELTTQEVAEVMRTDIEQPLDRRAAAQMLIRAVGRGAVQVEPLGDDGLWSVVL